MFFFIEYMYNIDDKVSKISKILIGRLTFPTQFKGILPEPGCSTGSTLGLGKPTSFAKTWKIIIIF